MNNVLINTQDDYTFNIRSSMPSIEKVQMLSEYFSSFSDCSRLRILILLSVKEMQVGDIADILKMNQTTVSHQLKTLRASDMVNYYRDGKKMVYYLTDRHFVDMMNDVVERFDY